MSLTKRTISAGAWQLASIVVKVIIQLFVIAILARHILPKDFGLIALANIVLVFVEMFSEAGIGPGIVQKKVLTKEHIRAGFTLAVLSGIFFFLVLWVIAPLIAEFFKSELLVDVIRWLGISMLALRFGTVARALEERDMRFDKLALVDVGSYVLGYAPVGIILTIFGYGVWAIVIGKLVQSCMQSVSLFVVRSHSVKPLFIVEEYRQIGSYGGGLTIARFFDNVASQGDLFVVGRFLGMALLGIYERAVSIMAMPGQYLGFLVDKIMFPAMSKIQNEERRLQNAYLRVVGFVNIILVPFSVLMFFLAPELILVLLGHKWSAAVVPFRILIVILNLRIAGSLSDTLVRATGAVYASGVRKMIYAFFVISGSLIGRYWGIVGVAVAVNVAVFIHYVMFTQLSMKLISISWATYFSSFKSGYVVGAVLFIINFILIPIVRFYTGSAAVILLVSCAVSILLLIVVIFRFFPEILDRSVFWFLFQVMGERCWKLPVVGNRIKSYQSYSKLFF